MSALDNVQPRVRGMLAGVPQTPDVRVLVSCRCLVHDRRLRWSENADNSLSVNLIRSDN